MRAVVQRVLSARVSLEHGQVIGSIGPGLLVLLGVEKDDGPEQAEKLARKIACLRIFDDETGKMNRSVGDIGGGALVVSNFTLYGNCRRGRRPDFTAAAGKDQAQALYEAFVACLEEAGLRVETGRFGAFMKVELVNDGPVTLVIDTDEL